MAGWPALISCVMVWCVSPRIGSGLTKNLCKGCSGLVGEGSDMML